MSNFYYYMAFEACKKSLIKKRKQIKSLKKDICIEENANKRFNLMDEASKYFIKNAQTEIDELNKEVKEICNAMRSQTIDKIGWTKFKQRELLKKVDKNYNFGLRGALC